MSLDLRKKSRKQLRILVFVISLVKEQHVVSKADFRLLSGVTLSRRKTGFWCEGIAVVRRFFRVQRRIC